MKYTQKQEINLDVKELFSCRGIFDFQRYLYPSEEDLIDPHKLNNIETAAELLIKHISNKSNITILVDCDQDGYTSAAIIWQYIKLIDENAKLSYKVHDGKQHGLEDMKDLLDEEVDLLIIPDASSNDYDLHKLFYENGVEILVLDHHEAEKESQFAVVVNNQLSEDYTNKALSGAGVVYKFCKVLDEYYDCDFADDFLDLAAVGIIGDMMSVVPMENRYIIKTGLNNIVNPFLKEIIKQQSFSISDINNVTPFDVSFYIAPLINALIRVGKEEEKENLFLAFIDGDRIVESTKRGHKGETEVLKEQSVRCCKNARTRQNNARDKAIDILDMRIKKNELDMNKIIVVETEDYDKINPNLTGLIAMQLVARYKKPVIVCKENSDGFLRGSARGDSSSELKDLKQFFNDSGFFEYAEGHPQAHGISIDKRSIDSFLDYSNKKLENVNFNTGLYEVDFVIDANLEKESFKEFIFDVAALRDCWGKENESPLIAIKNIHSNIDDISVIGKGKDTLKFVYNGIEYIMFKAKDVIEKFNGLVSFDLEIVGEAGINEWMGNVKPQIKIVDLNIIDTSYNF